jgi:thymidylate synthase
LRKNVTIHDHRDIKDFSKLDSIIKKIPKKKSYGKPEVYPKKQIKAPVTFPSEKAGFIVRDEYIEGAWIKILNIIMRFGSIKESQYSEDQKEIIGLMSIIEKEDPNNPKVGHSFDFTIEGLEDYYPQVLTGKRIDGVEYTYGQRLRDNKGIDQIAKMIEKLKKTRFTRRAIAFTWDVATDYDNEKSPCLNVVHAIVQDEKLFLTAYFRSNDMYNAWPKNAFALRKLQGMIAEKVGIGLGSLCIISNSAHIYKNSWKKADIILKEFPSKMSSIGDPRGNIILRVEENKIVAVIQGPDGKRTDELKASSAKEMYEKLYLMNAVSEYSHAFYIGTELQKAEIAIRKKMKYLQDKELK